MIKWYIKKIVDEIIDKRFNDIYTEYQKRCVDYMDYYESERFMEYLIQKIKRNQL